MDKLKNNCLELILKNLSLNERYKLRLVNTKFRDSCDNVNLDDKLIIFIKRPQSKGRLEYLDESYELKDTCYVNDLNKFLSNQQIIKQLKSIRKLKILNSDLTKIFNLETENFNELIYLSLSDLDFKNCSLMESTKLKYLILNNINCMITNDKSNLNLYTLISLNLKSNNIKYLKIKESFDKKIYEYFKKLELFNQLEILDVELNDFDTLTYISKAFKSIKCIYCNFGADVNNFLDHVKLVNFIEIIDNLRNDLDLFIYGIQIKNKNDNQAMNENDNQAMNENDNQIRNENDNQIMNENDNQIKNKNGNQNKNKNGNQNKNKNHKRKHKKKMKKDKNKKRNKNNIDDKYIFFIEFLYELRHSFTLTDEQFCLNLNVANFKLINQFKDNVMLNQFFNQFNSLVIDHDLFDDNLIMKFKNCNELSFNYNKYNPSIKLFKKYFEIIHNLLDFKIKVERVDLKCSNKTLNFISEKKSELISLDIECWNQIKFDFLFNLTKLNFLQLLLYYPINESILLDLILKLKYLNFINIAFKSIENVHTKEYLVEFKNRAINHLKIELKTDKFDFQIKIYKRKEFKLPIIKYLFVREPYYDLYIDELIGDEIPKLFQDKLFNYPNKSL